MYNGENWCCDRCGKETLELMTKEVEDSNGDSMNIDLCVDCWFDDPDSK